ncbi:hypothetical protein [Oceanobacillus kapialis]|uniref:hypothetical protein n=1 Tax=Oceanobacillus kapialis TaxID=481353 RepID=UPI00384B92C5
MRKWYLLLCILATIILCSCGGKPIFNFTLEQLDKMITVVSEDKELGEYIKNIQAVEISSSETEYWYSIKGELTKSFDELSTEKQYKKFARVVELMQKNQGEIIGYSEFYCGEKSKCSIIRINLKTPKHTYEVEYYPDSESQFLKKDDSIVYDSETTDGIYIDPFETEDNKEDVNTDTKKQSDREFSKTFSNYNKEFYEIFKNNLDLIGSNFELIHEGNYSPALIGDLITWIEEFNEIIDVYESKAIPITKADQELYIITNDMVTNQREANAYILKGLNNEGAKSLIEAGEYLNSSIDLYTKGYNLIQ